MLIGAAMPQFLVMRELFKRDYSSKYYSSAPFTLAMLLVELPYLVLAGSLCIVCCYWSSGFDVGNSMDGFYFWLAFVLYLIYCHSFGIFIAYGFLPLLQRIGFVCLPSFVLVLLLPTWQLR